MGKYYSEKQRNLPPSQRKYVKHLAVPDGCVDVWRISIVDSTRPSIHSNWMDRELCMNRADELHERTKLHYRDPQHLHYVYVEHKAATEIAGKWHIVNIPSFKFAEELAAEQLPTKEHDHTEWLREFEGRPMISDPDEGVHHEINYVYPDEEK